MLLEVWRIRLNCSSVQNASSVFPDTVLSSLGFGFIFTFYLTVAKIKMQTAGIECGDVTKKGKINSFRQRNYI